MNDRNLGGVESVSASMREMIPNWSFTTNKQAQKDAEVRNTTDVPEEKAEEIVVDDQTRKVDGSWLV